LMSSDVLPIGEVARRSGKAASAIRYYEAIGLLPAATRESGRRRYAVETVQRLRVIDTAQRAGLTLEEIRLLVEDGAGEELRRVAERKLPELDALIRRAEVVRAWLEHAARCQCADLDECPLFDDAELPPTR
jgi:MerR family transcriptional regulator, redox-sensitive transcriptional activator SoxR